MQLDQRSAIPLDAWLFQHPALHSLINTNKPPAAPTPSRPPFTAIIKPPHLHGQRKVFSIASSHLRLLLFTAPATSCINHASSPNMAGAWRRTRVLFSYPVSLRPIRYAKTFACSGHCAPLRRHDCFFMQRQWLSILSFWCYGRLALANVVPLIENRQQHKLSSSDEKKNRESNNPSILGVVILVNAIHHSPKFKQKKPKLQPPYVMYTA